MVALNVLIKDGIKFEISIFSFAFSQIAALEAENDSLRSRLRQQAQIPVIALDDEDDGDDADEEDTEEDSFIEPTNIVTEDSLNVSNQNVINELTYDDSDGEPKSKKRSLSSGVDV